MRGHRAEEVRRRWDRAVAAAVLLFAAYVVDTARGMAYWQGRIPGPGFVPLWLGIGLAVAAAGVLATARQAPRGGPPAPGARTRGPEAGTHGHGTGATARGAEAPVPSEAAAAAPGRPTAAAGLAAAAVIAVALVERIGMALALVLLVAASVRLLGGAWRTALLAAVGLTAGLVLLFGRWLQVPLPRGPWGF